MTTRTFNIGSAARIVIERCHGDIKIEGGDREGVEVSGDGTHGARIAESDGGLLISGYHGDLRVKTGVDAQIVANRVSGDVTVENVSAVELQLVGGDLSVRGVGAITVHNVGGDLEAELRGGAAEIGRVGGDLELQNAATLSLRAVGGDADLSGIERIMSVGHIGGDLRLQWAGALAGATSGFVGGDAQLTVGDEANFVLRATVGGEIAGDGLNPAPGTETYAHEDDAATDDKGDIYGWQSMREGGTLVVTFGEGGDDFSLRVGGDLALHGGRVTSSNFSPHGGIEIGLGDFAGIGDEMRKFGREMKAMGRDLARDLAREVRSATRGVPGSRPRFHVQVNDRAFHFDQEQIDRITREAREAAASGVARAQEAVERALVNIVSTRGTAPRPPRPPQPVRHPRPPQPGQPPQPGNRGGPGFTGQTVRIEREAPPPPMRSAEEVQEEKLAILRMVSEGRLAIDEAEVMLRALEERG